MLIKKIFKYFFLVILVIGLEISFIPNMFWPFNLLNMALIVLIIITEVINYKTALILAIIIGSIIDLFNYNFFLTKTIILILTLTVINKIFIHFFTNKSIYSICFLLIIGLIIYNSVENLFDFFYSLIQNNLPEWNLLFSLKNLKRLGYILVINTTAIILIYSIVFLRLRRTRGYLVK